MDRLWSRMQNLGQAKVWNSAYGRSLGISFPDFSLPLAVHGLENSDKNWYNMALPLSSLEMKYQDWFSKG